MTPGLSRRKGLLVYSFVQWSLPAPCPCGVQGRLQPGLEPAYDGKATRKASNSGSDLHLSGRSRWSGGLSEKVTDRRADIGRWGGTCREHEK